MVRADGAVPGRADDRARLDDRECRPAVHQTGPAVQRRLAGVGRQCLPADLRRLPAARRAAGRSVRPSAPVPGGHRGLHPGLAGVRAVVLADRTGDRARRAGFRRRGGHCGRAVADHDAVPPNRPIARRRWASTASCARAAAASACCSAACSPARSTGTGSSWSTSRSARSCSSLCLRLLPGGSGHAAGGKLDVARRGDCHASADARGVRDRRRQRSRLDVAARRSACSPRRSCCSACSSSSKRACANR